MNSLMLKHPTVRANIHAAMVNAANPDFNCDHVYNSAGLAFLRVERLTGNNARILLGVSSGFYFTDRNYKNVTPIVLKGLRS